MNRFFRHASIKWCDDTLSLCSLMLSMHSSKINRTTSLSSTLTSDVWNSSPNPSLLLLFRMFCSDRSLEFLTIPPNTVHYLEDVPLSLLPSNLSCRPILAVYSSATSPLFTTRTVPSSMEAYLFVVLQYTHFMRKWKHLELGVSRKSSSPKRLASLSSPFIKWEFSVFSLFLYSYWKHFSRASQH